MKLKPIINSLLETDAYKFSMGQTIFHQFNKDKVVWSFKCRNDDVKFTPEMVQEIRMQLDHYCTLRFTEDELEWLGKNMPWIKEDYIDYLRFWHPRRSEILVNEGNIQDYNDCGLAIECHGTALNTSPYEIAILSIVNEVYFAFKYGVGEKDIEFQKCTIEKFDKLQDAMSVVYGSTTYEKSHPYDIGTFSEFGMRRRYSSAMQDWLIKYITDQKIPGFVGTSNVYLAKKYNVKAVGTCAHEMGMCLLTDDRYNPAYVNSRLMEIWVNEYGVENGIYLTDIIGRRPFLMDFNKKYATLFNGLRHDSGDPIQWGEDMIEHYKNLGIDARTKTLLFSDSLNFERASKIKKYFDGKCKVAFGIGTYLAGIQGHDDNGNEIVPLNIVMKVKEVNGKPTCKLTDNLDKAIGDKDYIDYVRRCIDWRIRYSK